MNTPRSRSQPREPGFLPSALVLVVLPALAGGVLGAYIGVSLVPDSLISGGVGAFWGALAGPVLALFAWFLCGAWRRRLAPAWITGFPLAPAWITGFYAIGLALAVVGALPWDAIAVDSRPSPPPNAPLPSATPLIIVGGVVLLEGVVVLLETYHSRRRRHTA